MSPPPPDETNFERPNTIELTVIVVLFTSVYMGMWMLRERDKRRKQIKARRMGDAIRISDECRKAVRDRVADAMKNNDASHDLSHVKRVVHHAITMALDWIGQGHVVDLQVVELAAWLHDLRDWKYQSNFTQVASPVMKSSLEIKAEALQALTTQGPRHAIRVLLTAWNGGNSKLADSLLSVVKDDQLTHVTPTWIETEAAVYDPPPIIDMKQADAKDWTSASGLTEWLEPYKITHDQIQHIVTIVDNMSWHKTLDPRFTRTVYKSGLATIAPSNPPPSIEAMIVQRADRLDAMGAIGVMRAFTYGGYKNRTVFDGTRPPLDYKDSADYKARSSQSTTVNHFFEKLLKLNQLWDHEPRTLGVNLADERHDVLGSFVTRLLEELRCAGDTSVDTYLESPLVHSIVSL